MKKKVIILLFIFFCFSCTVSAEAGKTVGRKTKGISGEVSAISKNFIAVVYRRDVAKGTEEEISFPVAKDVKIEHKKSLDQIGVGDMVDIQFEEVTEETKEGVISKRAAKVITFLRAAPAPISDSSALISGAEKEQEEGQ